jgi:hypothetical protein
MTFPERLPCEVELAALLAQVADSLPASDPGHQESCPYCQAALRRLRSEWADLQELTHKPVAVPEGLTSRIMRHVRTLAGQAADSVLLGSAHGETRVSHVAVARAIQRLAASVPGVIFASARVLAQPTSQPRRVGTTIRLVVTFGPTLHSIADDIRVVLHRYVPNLTGTEIVRIDIMVMDISQVSD